MKMQGYNGSQLWDTAFAVQAYAATGLLPACGDALRNAHAYIKEAQVVTEAGQPLQRYYRHISVGAWPFSTRDHGWPISDCTSEVRCFSCTPCCLHGSAPARPMCVASSLPAPLPCAAPVMRELLSVPLLPATLSRWACHLCNLIDDASSPERQLVVHRVGCQGGPGACQYRQQHRWATAARPALLRCCQRDPLVPE